MGTCAFVPNLSSLVRRDGGAPKPNLARRPTAVSTYLSTSGISAVLRYTSFSAEELSSIVDHFQHSHNGRQFKGYASCGQYRQCWCPAVDRPPPVGIRPASINGKANGIRSMPSKPTYQSPERHHRRAPSYHREVKVRYRPHVVYEQH